MSKKILIMGVGNILLGDEGVGPASIGWLQKNQWPETVDLLDGGTGGFHLLSLFQDYSTIILIDAALDHSEEGTVRLIEPHYASDFPPTLSAHDIGLKDLIESATLINAHPKIYLVTVSIDPNQDLVMQLSPAIAASLPEIEKQVRIALEQSLLMH
jgi:hydrogenase maturation protease